MKTMLKNSAVDVQPFLSNLKGSTAIEYGVIVGLVSVVSIGAIYAAGIRISDIYDSSASSMTEDDLPSVEQGDGAPVEPAGPYDAFTQTGVFLIGTSDADALDMKQNGPYDGVLGLEGDDSIIDSSAAEVIIPGPGDDFIGHTGGDDTFVYANNDGHDVIDRLNGNTKYEFPDIASYESTFIVKSNDHYIYLPNGSVKIDHPYYKPNGTTKRIEEVKFSDRTYDWQQIRDKAAEDAKSSGVVQMPKLPNNITNRAGDGTYILEPSSKSGNTLTFADTNYADARFKSALSGSSLRIYTQDNDYVEIKYHFHTSMGDRFDTITFADGISPSFQDTVNKAAEDGKTWGNVGLTDRSETMYHAASQDGSYEISGDRGGYDVLNFTETTYDQAQLILSYGGRSLSIKDAIGNNVEIEYHVYPSLTGIIDDITFADGKTPTMQEIVNAAAENAKPTGHINLSGFSEDLFHTASVDGSYEIAGINAGNDTLTFTETTWEDVRFTSSNLDRGHITIWTADNDSIKIDYYLDNPYVSAVVDQLVFPGGKTPTDQEIIDKINAG